ncbi:MAG: cell envelope integrity EipB family protein [Beijerinckiaceae bacterium]|nr:cell envelope integrity EipB family protein [Beijerinckiaceae bacterium]
MHTMFKASVRSAAIAALFIAAPALAQEVSPDSPLAPHRAVYDLRLLKSTGSNAPVAASGRIVYDFTGSSCEGYTVSFRQFTELTPSEGENRTSDMRSTTYESADRKTFRFRVQQLDGNKVTSTVDGEAVRSGDGALSLALKQPVPSQADIDHDAVFPTDMMLQALKAAQSGQPILALKVFDGSDGGEKIYHTMSIIGKPVAEPLTDATKDVGPMKSMRRWTTRVSYFDVEKVDAPAVYVLTFQMWENGVSSDLIIDYGDFQLKGEMTAVDFLPVKPCP